MGSVNASIQRVREGLDELSGASVWESSGGLIVRIYTPIPGTEDYRQSTEIFLTRREYQELQDHMSDMSEAEQRAFLQERYTAAYMLASDRIADHIESRRGTTTEAIPFLVSRQFNILDAVPVRVREDAPSLVSYYIDRREARTEARIAARGEARGEAEGTSAAARSIIGDIIASRTAPRDQPDQERVAEVRGEQQQGEGRPRETPLERQRRERREARERRLANMSEEEREEYERRLEETTGLFNVDTSAATSVFDDVDVSQVTAENSRRQSGSGIPSVNLTPTPISSQTTAQPVQIDTSSGASSVRQAAENVGDSDEIREVHVSSGSPTRPTVPPRERDAPPLESEFRRGEGTERRPFVIRVRGGEGLNDIGNREHDVELTFSIRGESGMTNIFVRAELTVNLFRPDMRRETARELAIITRTVATQSGILEEINARITSRTVDDIRDDYDNQLRNEADDMLRRDQDIDEYMAPYDGYDQYE